MEVDKSTDTTATSSKDPMATAGADGGIEICEECRPCKTMPDAGMPSAQERKTHNYTVMQFRAWCKHCV